MRVARWQRGQKYVERPAWVTRAIFVRQRRHGRPSRSYASSRAPSVLVYRAPVARSITRRIAANRRRTCDWSSDAALARGSIFARHKASEA